MNSVLPISSEEYTNFSPSEDNEFDVKKVGYLDSSYL